MDPSSLGVEVYTQAWSFSFIRGDCLEFTVIWNFQLRKQGDTAFKSISTTLWSGEKVLLEREKSDLM